MCYWKIMSPTFLERYGINRILTVSHKDLTFTTVISCIFLYIWIITVSDIILEKL